MHECVDFQARVGVPVPELELDLIVLHFFTQNVSMTISASCGVLITRLV